ncbi:hypothetical protein DFH09DRAFT_1432162 [Mycena vulgaris]|nr:hypothetical protein DFH09DRAFT_1432162 [Mycena vulgaris]
MSHNSIVLLDPPSLKRNDNPLNLQDLINQGRGCQETYKFAEFKLKPAEEKTKLALYFPSSGTTGVPKMVAIPHASFISNIIQTAAHDAGVDMAVSVVEWKFRPGNVPCAVPWRKKKAESAPDIFGLVPPFRSV